MPSHRSEPANRASLTDPRDPARQISRESSPGRRKEGFFYVAFTVGVLSASTLSYEILLTRVFAITQWHDLAHAVISLALLGFGVSGTILTLARRWCERTFGPLLYGGCLAFGLSAYGCYWLSQRLAFNPFMLLWDPREWGRLALGYALLSVPFFFAASVIGLSLMRYRQVAGRLYAADLTGASVGALGTLGLLFLQPPHEAIRSVAILGILASIPVGRMGLGFSRSSGQDSSQDRSWWNKRWVRPLLGICFPLALIALIVPLPMPLNISPYKELSVARNLPQVQELDTAFSPLGMLHLLDSPAFHHAPGLSLNYTGDLPRQRGIFVDAGGMSPIVQFDGRFPAYLDAMTSAVGYVLLDRPRVLVLGAGGGSDVLAALAHDASAVDAVELNPTVIEWVRRDPQFSGGIYDENRYPVRVIIQEARHFVETTSRQYDLITLTLLDSVSATAAGVYALNEGYLYTREAMASMLRRLRPGGVLLITRWARHPPRDSLKLFATALEVLGPRAAQQIAMIRSWRTVTLVIKRTPLTPEDTQRIRAFCRARSFDLVYLPELKVEEVNRYHQLESPVYYEGCQLLLSSQREAFLREYPYRIAPATDDRPYFFYFFRWSALQTLLRQSPGTWFPVEEWGYLLLLATLVQSVGFSILLIVLPLFSLKGTGKRTGAMRPGVLLYFLMLGIGFMFIEITTIQRLVLFLGHPTYAVAVALGAFLLFAGLGSQLSARWNWRGERLALIAGGIGLLALLHALVLPTLLRELMGLNLGWRLGISLGVLAPLGLGMGMPFPVGLTRVGERAPQLVPWAWGINGCASVISAVLALMVAMNFGFRITTLIAAGCYGVAGGIGWGFLFQE